MPKLGPLVYETYGTLNTAGDNCVLLPSYYAGTDKSYLPMIGAGRVLDPARWFIVAPNMLGNGVSDSPSNCQEYVQASIADNVNTQAEMLAALGVKRIELAYGWSMGAMQSLAWAAMFPEMVEAVLAVCGTARCWPLNAMFIEGLKAVLPAGRRAFGRAYAGWAYSAAFYRGELWRGMGFGSLEEFIGFWEDDCDSYDERDLLAMLWTWQHAQFGFEELSRITARVVMMPCTRDMYFTEEEARLEAVMIPGAQIRVLDSPYGHCAGAPGRFAAETAAVEHVMRGLLGDVPWEIRPASNHASAAEKVVPRKCCL